MQLAAVQRFGRELRETVVAEVEVPQIRQRGCAEVVRQSGQLVEAKVDNGQQIRVLVVALFRFQGVLRNLRHQVVAQVDGRDGRAFGKQLRGELFDKVVR